MAWYEKAVRDVLRSNNCSFVRPGKGDHEVWYSPLTNKNFPVDSKIKSRHVANTIMRQAGIGYKF